MNGNTFWLNDNQFLTILLETSKANAPLSVNIFWNGQVWFGDDKRLALPTFKAGLPATFRLTRKLEMHIATLQLNGNNGNELAARKAKKLTTALRNCRTTGIPLNAALAGVGYTDLKGLAQILAR